MKAPLLITVRGWLAYHLWMATPGSGHGFFRLLWWGLLPYIGDWAYRDQPYRQRRAAP